jgi:DNA polymerase elongation subunit (family B)
MVVYERCVLIQILYLSRKTRRAILTCLMQNIERKGLDMVRRDWSLLSKEIGDFCLNQILSGG